MPFYSHEPLLEIVVHTTNLIGYHLIGMKEKDMMRNDLILNKIYIWKERMYTELKNFHKNINNM